MTSGALSPHPTYMRLILAVEDGESWFNWGFGHDQPPNSILGFTSPRPTQGAERVCVCVCVTLRLTEVNQKVSGEESTSPVPVLVQSSPLKQAWKPHKTPENSGVAFGTSGG